MTVMKPVLGVGWKHPALSPWAGHPVRQAPRGENASSCALGCELESPCAGVGCATAQASTPASGHGRHPSPRHHGACPRPARL